MSPTLRFPILSLENFQQMYASGLSIAEVLGHIEQRIAERGADSVWIYRPTLETLLATAPTDRSLPLFGVPFAVKDNIDVAGWPTTAGCEEFSQVASKDAPVVARLRAAGAIPIGKTNMDQFATGLVGTRSPFGIPRCVFDQRYISGGSSSGSAVAVAAGLACFALGTDTAGSGRVPAGFNDLVGLKPTKGRLSTTGVVPACRSLDCVSIFTSNVADAQLLLEIANGYDPEDPFSRRQVKVQPPNSPQRIGIPPATQLEFFSDAAAEKLFHQAVERFRAAGFPIVEIDFTPFAQAAQLLYSGPWVAERLVAIQGFFQKHAEVMNPVVRQIIGGASKLSALDAYQGLYELGRLRQLAEGEWEKMDVLLLPTTGTIFTVEEVLADPISLNSKLGLYTNFVNLLDLCAIAIPAGFRPTNQLPFGITLLAPAFQDESLCVLAGQFLGETPRPIAEEPRVLVSVVGAHLKGQPLNDQLTERGAELVRTCRSAKNYRLFALANTTPPKPGLVRSPGFDGGGIELEVWSMSAEAFGEFVAQIPAPMGIGTVELEDGTSCKGFLCEPYSLEGALEITHHGGWRAFLGAD